MARSSNLATRIRLQFAVAMGAAAVGSLLGFVYARYDLPEHASRTLTAMYACFGAVAALVTVRVGALVYRMFKE